MLKNQKEKNIRNIVLFIEMKDCADAIKVMDKQCRTVVLVSHALEIEERYSAYALQTFSEIKRIMKEKPLDNVLIQIIVPFNDESFMSAGLINMIKTAHLENPKVWGQIILIDKNHI